MGIRITIGSALIGVNLLLLILTEYMTLSQGKVQLALVAFGMNTVNIGFLHLAFKTHNDYLKLFGFATLIHHLHRIPFFVDPSSSRIYNPFLAVWGIPKDSAVTYSLLIILLFQVVGGITILICGYTCRLRLYLDQRSELDNDFSPLFYLYCLLQAVFLYNYLALGVGRRAIESNSLKWLGLVLNSDVVLVLLAFGIFMNWKRYNREWLRVLGVLFFTVSVAIATVWGSRRGIYQFVIIGTITMMVVYPHRKWYVGVKKLAMASVLLLALVLTYAVGTEYRRVVLFESKEPGVKAIMSVNPLRASFGVWDQRQIVFEKIWYRMSQLDDVMMAILVEDRRFDHEIDFANNLRVLANYLVIGDIFPGVLVSGRAWGVDYYGNTVGEAWANYTTWVPGAFGYSVATFGVIGGLASLSILIWLFVVAARWGCVLVPPAYRKYYALAIIYLFFGSVIGGMGLDELGFTIFLWIIQTGLIVLFVTSYKMVHRVVRPEKIEPLAYVR